MRDKNNIRVEIDQEEDSYDLIMQKMHEGNKEAREILSYMKLVNVFAMEEIMILDDMNIRGLQIKYAKDYCGWDNKSFFESIRNRDPIMIQAVNRETAKNKRFKDKAVLGGATCNRQFLSEEEVETLSKLPKIWKGRDLS